MKKIINGKKYDTETAKKLGYWWNGLSSSDFKYCEETLYKKRTGEFFLYGEGGAMTTYAQKDGDGLWMYGEAITPMTKKDAKRWVEHYLSVDEYEENFGEVEE